jgi:hypothetical protein
MRIIGIEAGVPYSQQAIIRIAQECVNLEMGAEVYVGGEMVIKEITRQTPPYPIITKFPHSYIFRAGCAKVFVNHSEVDVVVPLIQDAFKSLPRPPTSKAYIPYAQNAITNIKTCPQSREFNISVEGIISFPTSITTDNARDILPDYLASVYYDPDGLCNLSHDSLVFHFSEKNMRGIENILDLPSITLFPTNKNPLIAELTTNQTRTFRELPCDVWECDRDSLKIVGVNYPGTNTVSTDICCKCYSPLYDENYALYRHSENMGSHDVEQVCALCMHGTSNTYEKSYFAVLKIRSAKTIKDIINDITNPQLKDVYNAITEELLQVTIRNIVMYVAGKYAFVQNRDTYIYNGLSSAPELADKKIVICKIIG